MLPLTLSVETGPICATLRQGPNSGPATWDVKMYTAAITGTGVYTPSERITNAELVKAFNAYVDLQNAKHAEAIAAGGCRL